MNNLVRGHIVDLHKRQIYPAEVMFSGAYITSIKKVESAPDQFIMPGFIDAHIHIESSMLVPFEFARIALKYGTVATVSDPHEIANVLGKEGVLYMIENAKGAGLKFHFGAPSCVPATQFETAGATLHAEDVYELLQRDDIHFLSEMMNYPGILAKDEQVLRKIDYARKVNKVVDGHAPGLRGAKAKLYIDAGISTDHECFSLEEALDKLKYGMKIIIREGSAAKNYEALHSLIQSHPKEVMFCSDDKHPDDLMKGHIDLLVKRSLVQGYDLFDVLTIACANPVFHYGLDAGLLREKDRADFIIVENLQDFKVKNVYINGQEIVSDGKMNLPTKSYTIKNRFSTSTKKIEDFHYSGPVTNVPTIQAIEGELITRKLFTNLEPTSEGQFSGKDDDVLKICVVNRYKDAPISTGFVRGFGLKTGAIASSVAHDSHNIIAVGVEDAALCEAVNLLISNMGGLSVVNGTQKQVLALPIAGLMSPLDCKTVAAQYQEIDSMAKALGSKLRAPFMTLSFMALLVIPQIKISDLGMFDAEKFVFY